MKILITGGAGFIGSAVVRLLISSTEHSVINVDKLTYSANLKNLNAVQQSPRYAFEKADICDDKELKKIFSNYEPDAIMHLAAESHVDRSIAFPSDFIRSNILGTFTLLEIARDYWKKLDINHQNRFRFLHVSTDEVYGDLSHPSDTNTPAKLPSSHEDTAYAPSNPYSASKASSDHLVRSWNRTYGLPVLVTNCSNNYGPYQYPEKLIPLVTLNALKKEPLPVYGMGDQIRDWLFVDDHAQALYKVLTKGKVGETYNIGGFNEMKNLEVVNIICDLLQELVPSSVNYHDLITHVDDRLGHDRRYAIDSRKIQHELGWFPNESLNSGLRKTVQWYISNYQ